MCLLCHVCLLSCNDAYQLSMWAAGFKKKSTQNFDFEKPLAIKENLCGNRAELLLSQVCSHLAQMSVSIPPVLASIYYHPAWYVILNTDTTVVRVCAYFRVGG